MKELFAILKLREVENRVGSQWPPLRTTVSICLMGMIGVREHVARIGDYTETALPWQEVLSRLEPREVIVNLVQPDDPTATDNITLWVTRSLIPDKEPLQGLSYLDESVVVTHEAGPMANAKLLEGKIPFRVVELVEDPELAEACV